MQFSTAVRNARADATEVAIGPSPIFRMRTGAQPANCAAARSGTVLATMNLPADFMANASAGSKAKLGTWEDLAADAAGTAAHWEIMDSAGTTCHAQGTLTQTGGGGEVQVDNPVLAVGQQVTITAFNINEGNA